MRRGLTLIELLVALVIILTLAGLAYTGILAVKRSQRKNETDALLRQLSLVLTQYQERYGYFGDNGNAADFAAKPWVYLGRRPRASGQPTLDIPRMRLGLNGQGNADPLMAETILDAWHRPLIWEIVNGTQGGRPYTVSAKVRSDCGTTTNLLDDLAIQFTIQSGAWEPVR